MKAKIEAAIRKSLGFVATTPLTDALIASAATAVLAAMREPTEAMLEAAGPAFREVDAILAIHELVRGRGPIAYPDQEPPLIHAWRAMIDAALKE